MARIDGRSPKAPRGTTPEEPAPDQPGRPSLSKRVAEPVSGRRGRFGYYSGFRPSRHRWIGAVLVVTGILIAVANDTMLFIDQVLLPFGHQELWLMAGVLVAGFGTVFLGLFDPSVRRRRSST
jgi:hypothetical protein